MLSNKNKWEKINKIKSYRKKMLRFFFYLTNIYQVSAMCQINVVLATFKKLSLKISLVVQWLKFCASTAGGTGSIPNQGTKIPHAMLLYSQKIKRERREW